MPDMKFSPADARLMLLRNSGREREVNGEPDLPAPGVSRLDQNSSWMDLARAALAREDIEILNHDLRAYGFLQVDDPRLSPQGRRDYNLDRALDLFVPTTYRQGAGAGAPPTETELEQRFVIDGEIQLLISTKQKAKHLIGLRGNVGDNFGLHVTEHLGRRPIAPFGTWIDNDRPVFMTVGSIMQHARDRGLVWGSGCIQPLGFEARARPTKSVFLGVRGPRSREQILRRFGINPPVIGDPGLLINEVCPVPNRRPDIECGFIVHSVDKPFFREKWPSAIILQNTDLPAVLAADILRCKRVVSSSLHGLIFSHSLGVPCAPVSFGDRLSGGDFKFIDYLQSLGVYELPARVDMSDGRPFELADWIGLVDKFPVPSANELRERLVRSFPFLPAKQPESSPPVRLSPLAEL